MWLLETNFISRSRANALPALFRGLMYVCVCVVISFHQHDHIVSQRMPLNRTQYIHMRRKCQMWNCKTYTSSQFKRQYHTMWHQLAIISMRYLQICLLLCGLSQTERTSLVSDTKCALLFVLFRSASLCFLVRALNTVKKTLNIFLNFFFFFELSAIFSDIQEIL